MAFEPEKFRLLIAGTGGREGGEQPVVLFLEGEAVLGGVVGIGKGSAGEGMGEEAGTESDGFKVHIGQLGEDEEVHVVERGFGKGNMAVGFQIIDHAFHLLI